MRFYLATDNADDTPIEKPLARISKIKRRHGDFNPEGQGLYRPSGDRAAVSG